MNTHLLGVYDFAASEAEYARLLQGWLNAASEGDLLMCHPAIAVEAGDTIGKQRPTEMAVLSDPHFDEWCASAAVELGRLSQGR